jgi:hypothetical protein
MFNASKKVGNFVFNMCFGKRCGCSFGECGILDADTRPVGVRERQSRFVHTIGAKQ